MWFRRELMMLAACLSAVACAPAATSVDEPEASSAVADLPPLGHCAPTEQVVYACARAGEATILVCSSDSSVRLEFLPADGAPVRLLRREAEGTAFSSDSVCCHGSHQWRLRFVEGDTSYVVFAGSVRPEDARDPVKRSGLSIEQGENVLRLFECEEGHSLVNRGAAARFAFEREDPQLDGWR